MIYYKHILMGLMATGLMSGCGGDSDDDIAGSHNQGKDCIACHSNFTVAGTIFTQLDASDGDDVAAAYNHTLKLALEEGTEITLIKGYGSGNAYTTVNSSAIGAFTAEVLDAEGKLVNSSATLSHDADMLNCNTCHSQNGENRAPGRIINFRL